jgi:hypothetical protein
MTKGSAASKSNGARARDRKEDIPMHPKDRFDYSAIVDRPPLKLPGGARLVVSTVVNVENWNFDETIPRQVLTTPAGNFSGGRSTMAE